MASSRSTTIPVERADQGFPARHWQVIDAMRRAFLESGSTPWLPLSRVSDVPIDELYRLFPRGPSRLVAKIAGIPNLRSCT
jgi:tRNA 2-thiouridine synthesizing protein E